ncbi:MAG: MFS transporter [Lachnospiraceae bacterium]|nr:MFS transporter [Lachnospiraceae bacterium]
MEAQKGQDNGLGYSPEAYVRFRSSGIRLLVLFSVFYATFYCTRLNLANAGAKMMEELGLTSGEIGVLTACLFWGYAAGNLLGGRWTELLGVKLSVVISAAFSIALNVTFGFTGSFLLMAVLWAANGFVQALCWPAGCAMIANWWPSVHRGFAIGFASAFAGFGQALAAAMVAVSFMILPSLGWRSAFFLPALLPLVFLLIFILFTRESPEAIGLPGYREENPELRENEEEMDALVRTHGKWYPYLYLLRNVRFVVVQLIHIFIGIARYGLLTWIPLYFVERFGVDIMEGLFTSLALPVGMGIGSLILPTMTDRFRNRMRVVPLSAFISAAAVLGFLFLDPRTSAGLILTEILLFTAGFFIYAIAAVLNTVTSDLCGRVLAGTGNGIMGFCGYLGAGLQSLVYGLIIHVSGWNMVFVSITVLLVVSAVLAAAPGKRRAL